MIQVIDNTFILTNDCLSYSFFLRDNRLVFTYFGKPLEIKIEDDLNLINNKVFPYFGNDCQRFEIGERGRGDFRCPSFASSNSKTLTTDFKFVDYKIYNEEVKDYTYPHIRNIKETLEIIVFDKFQNLELHLYYSLIDNALIKKAKIINKSDKKVTLNEFSSGMIDFPINNYEILDLNGRWGNEFNIQKQKAYKGIYTFSSTRGVSSHQHNPCIVIGENDINEDYGNVYGFALVYSGNFNFKVEVDEKNQLRLIGGYQFIGNGYELEPNKELFTPELVNIFSPLGLTDLSLKFHDLINKNLVNPKYNSRNVPIVLNSWESMYFSVNDNSMTKFIEKAKGLGFDTIVLDDGWFKNRNDDHTSLGDWVIDDKKFKNGFDEIIKLCKTNGMKFGLWFEPEAISPKSDLYNKNKNYAIENENIKGLELRNQLVLDFSKDEVINNIFNQMKLILDKYDISYIKWDMNRPLSDTYDSNQYVDYCQGVYKLYNLINENYPDILIEGCSSGGGRFDLGILFYSPYIWLSDDTDGYERMKIEYGASLFYPLRVLSNHVSICPNHQTGRTTPLFTRYAVASLGSLGYELNLSKLTELELNEIKKQIADYKKVKDLIYEGDCYRLENPFTSNNFSIEVLSKDKTEGYLVFSNILVKPNLPIKRLRFKGLLENKTYYIEELNMNINSNILMNLGIDVQMKQEDFSSVIMHFKLIKE